MTRLIRCIDCKHLDEQKQCARLQFHQPNARHRRRCESYEPSYLKMLHNLNDARRRQAPIDHIRRAIECAGLSHHLVELADLGNGCRMLRLRHGVPEAERFQLYELAGIRVIENQHMHKPNSQAPAAPRRPSHQGASAA